MPDPRPAASRTTLALALALALALPGCATERTEPARPPGRAVVIAAPERMADGERARAILHEAGWLVDLEPEGPSTRPRSSLAVYGLRDPGTARRVAELLAPVGELELLPFFQRGPGDTQVVVWLVR